MPNPTHHIVVKVLLDFSAPASALVPRWPKLLAERLTVINDRREEILSIKHDPTHYSLVNVLL